MTTASTFSTACTALAPEGTLAASGPPRGGCA
jgi:hypothetical protein